MSVPTKRLIVFAGFRPMYLPALQRAKVDAVMGTYPTVSDGAAWQAAHATLLTWPVVRYLDSGVFHFIHQSSAGNRLHYTRPRTVKEAVGRTDSSFVESLRNMARRSSGSDQAQLVKRLVSALPERPMTLQDLSTLLNASRSSVQGAAQVAYHQGVAEHRITGKQHFYWKNPSYTDYDMRLSSFSNYLTSYLKYLHTNKGHWDHIVEMDVDTIVFGRDDGTKVSGEIVAQRARKLLRVEVGERLLPVWHQAVDVPPYPKFRALIEEYPYIAVGSDGDIRSRGLRKLLDEAHRRGVRVHGFGTSRADILELVPFDTADSTTWLAAERFRRFGGYSLSERDMKTNRAVSQSRILTPLLEELGYTIADLAKDRIARLSVAALVMMKRQAELPPIRSEEFGDVQSSLFGEV